MRPTALGLSKDLRYLWAYAASADSVATPPNSADLEASLSVSVAHLSVFGTQTCVRRRLRLRLRLRLGYAYLLYFTLLKLLYSPRGICILL